MEENKMQQQIDDLNKKMDILLEEMNHQKRRRLEMEELKDDLMRVGQDVFKTTVEELEEIQDHVNTGDILHLGKKLLRNVNTITQTFELLESAKGFLEDFTPVSRELAFDLMKKMDELDRIGYFEFIKELERIGDNIVTAFSVEDVRALGDNIVTMLNTLKNLTQPDMLKALNNGLEVYKKLNIEVDQDISFFQLIKQMNSPEMRKGLAFGMRFLKSLAEKETSKNNNTIKQITS